MYYSFWSEYTFIPYELLIKFDIRLQNVIHKLEKFFQEVSLGEFEQNIYEFYLAGSCIKSDNFRDIDIFLLTSDELDSITKNIKKEYFLYSNNSLTYKFDNDIIQLVYRKRFENKPLSYIVDIFDFYSTKIAFKCKINTKTFKIEVVNSEIREEFISYLLTNENKLTQVNRNPFVSLQRAIHFLKRGDDVPFSVFLDICSKISVIKMDEDIEKYFDRLQGNELDNIKGAIKSFIESKGKS